MKNKPLLSIIVPCFNCEDTLQATIESIEASNISFSYEIIFVNDGSSDSTPYLIDKLCATLPNSRKFNHEKNRGGGAARNTGIKNSDAKLILCIDSDDLIEPYSLQNLVDCIIKHKIDGAVFEKSIRFIDNNINLIDHISETDNFEIPFNLDYHFSNKNCPVSVNFMFTKESWLLCNGYPEHHGFDTQGFGFRFLAHNLKALTAPHTTYFHRIHTKKPSYYMREYTAGKINSNLIKVYEEGLPLFTHDAQELILSYREKGRYILIDSLRELHQIDNLLLKGEPDSRSVNYTYWMGIKKYSEGNLKEALNELTESILNGNKHHTALERVVELLCQSQDISVKTFIAEYQKNNIQINSFRGIWKRIKYKISNLLNITL